MNHQILGPERHSDGSPAAFSLQRTSTLFKLQTQSVYAIGRDGTGFVCPRLPRVPVRCFTVPQNACP